MARTASTAIGGYYPTPSRVVSHIVNAFEKPDAGTDVAVLDPCAGKGEAVIQFARGISTPRNTPKVYAIELENRRHDTLQENLRNYANYDRRFDLHGDAFSAPLKTDPENDGFSVLYLNPPYDTDKKFVRVEEKFLDRFTSTLMVGGVLVFIVPGYALSASANTLGQHYENIECFRFPDPDWDDFKQVVLFARRRTSLMSPVGSVVSMVQGLAKDPMSLPTTEMIRQKYIIPLCAHKTGVDRSFWVSNPVDMDVLRTEFKLWHVHDRGGRILRVESAVPDPTDPNYLTRVYPTLMPPKAAHIAAGIASGAFNGERVTADDPSTGAPDLLVKGVFDKEFVVIEEKENQEGDKVGEVAAQQPRLVVTVLDITTNKYHVLKSTVESSGTVNPAEMSVGDLLILYGQNLLKLLKEHCPVLHDPKNPDHAIEIHPMARAPFKAQAQGVMAAVKELGGLGVPMSARKGKAVVVLGEVGAGKSSMSLQTALTIGSNRPLVMCPPHLLENWQREVATVYPQARTMVLRDIDDVKAFNGAKDLGVVVGIVSRETAKLGHAWTPIRAHTRPVVTCPKCGANPPDKDLVKSHAVCENAVREPLNTAAAFALTLAGIILPGFPADLVVMDFFKTGFGDTLARTYRKKFESNFAEGEKLEDKEALQRKVQRGILRSRRLKDAVSTWVDTITTEAELEALVKILLGIAEPDFSLRVFKTLMERAKDTSNISPFVNVLLTIPYGVEAFEEGFGIYEQRSLAGTSPYNIPNVREDLRCLRSKAESLQTGAADHSWTYQDWSRVSGKVCYKQGIWGRAQNLVFALETLVASATWKKGGACGERLYQAVPDPRRYPLSSYISRKYPNCFDTLIVDECFTGDTLISAERGEVPIKDIREGERVWSRTESGEIVLRCVNRVFEKVPTKGLLRVETSEGILTCTPEHKFYADSQWVPAKDLREGQSLITSEGCQRARFLSVRESLETDDLVYDLEVDETHCYFAGNVLVHNCHELSSEGSAQERSGHRLMNIGHPVIALTGSIMNGYAASLFTNWWAMFRSFRQEFDRSDSSMFVDRYGYRKVLRQYVDRDSKKIVAYGSSSDRVELKETDRGYAPGVLPKFILSHLLRHAVTLHKTDLELDLPPLIQIQVPVIADDDLLSRHWNGVNALGDRIRDDRGTELHGKLWGQMAEIPSHLDRAVHELGTDKDTGDYVIKYPESAREIVGDDGMIVARIPGFPNSSLLPKEKAMLETLEKELSEGRRVLVFSHHIEVMPRLARIIEENLGIKVPILESSKVPTAKRQSWIDSKVVAKSAKVMVTNPICIQTGLNNLVYFHSMWWHENPACNPIVKRQAEGRLDRIGQTKEVRSYFPVINGSLQTHLHSLLLHKVAVSMATDGLDAETALQAAGVGDSGVVTGFSVGRILYDIITKGL